MQAPPLPLDTRPLRSHYAKAETWFHPQQLAMLGDDLLFCYLGLPQESGKSTALRLWLLRRAILWNGKYTGEHGYVSKTYKNAKENHERTVNDLRANPGGLVKATLSPPAIYLRNGTKLTYHSSETPNSIYGGTWSAAVIDEASRVSREAYLGVVTRLAKTGGPLRCGGNKYGNNWFNELCRDPSITTRMSASDALRQGLVDEATLQRWRNSVNDLEWQETYELQEVLGLNPFAVALARPPTPVKDDTPWLYGLDLAKRQDFTALVALNRQGQVVAAERYQWVDYPTSVRHIKEVVGNSLVYADANGVGEVVIDYLRETGVAVQGVLTHGATGSEAEVDRIARKDLLDYLAKAMELGQVECNRDDIRAELAEFSLVMRGQQPRYEVPEHLHDDMAFAFALAAHGWRYNQSLQFYGGF